jgi:hypothetical protein
MALVENVNLARASMESLMQTMTKLSESGVHCHVLVVVSVITPM